MTDLLRTLLDLDNLRAFNVALTLTTAVALWVRVNDDWHHLTRGFRVLVASHIGFPLVGTYGSAEAYIQDAQVGARTVALTVVCLIALLGLWLSRTDPAPGPSVSATAVLSVIEGVEGDEAVHGDPCAHPGCIAARIELRRLIAASGTHLP